MERLRAISARASAVRRTPHPSRATRTTSSGLTGPVPTATRSGGMGPWDTVSAGPPRPVGPVDDGPQRPWLRTSTTAATTPRVSCSARVSGSADPDRSGPRHPRHHDRQGSSGTACSPLTTSRTVRTTGLLGCTGSRGGAMETQPLEHATFDEPDEVREGDNWRLELVNLSGGAQVGRMTLQPGWRWSEDVKPVAGTELCEGA